MFRSFAAVTTLLMAACTTSPVISDAARSQLAPTGKLRAGMNLGNTLFTTKDAATGELRGVSVDLMRELASRLGVPLDLVVHATPGDVADAVEKGTWDVAILAIGTIATLQVLTSYLSFRFPPLRRVLEGEPIVLVDHGKFVHRNLRRERMTEDEIAEEARQQQIASLDKVQWAILEANGSISFIKSE